MTRYGTIDKKNKREIVLLQGFPCFWGRCSFCDYITDNSSDEGAMIKLNQSVLQLVTGVYGALEVVNSGSVFELPNGTMGLIKAISLVRGIRRLYFESAWHYRDRLREIRDFFGKNREILFKCGIESFDEDFRNGILNKGILFDSPEDVSRYFDSVCLLVGVLGQTKDIIERDIEILLKHFKYGCINIFNENSTRVKADRGLAEWFADKYGHLDDYPNIDILWQNTDFGVGLKND